MRKGLEAYSFLKFLLFTFYINGVRNAIEVIHNFAVFDRHFTFKLLFAIYFITGLIIKTKIALAVISTRPHLQWHQPKDYLILHV